MSTDEFKAPSSTVGVDWSTLKGSLLIVKPHSLELAIKTTYGDSDAVRADVIVLDGDEAETVYLDTLIFPKVLQSQVKSSMGGMVLGRLGQGVKKAGQSPPWTLSEATEADKVAARAYIAANTEAPF